MMGVAAAKGVPQQASLSPAHHPRRHTVSPTQQYQPPTEALR